MSVNISPQGQEIIKACELKVKLQGRAEVLSAEARDLIARLRVSRSRAFLLSAKIYS